jgi:hypothetical protein
MADNFEVHAYEQECNRHRAAARRNLQDVVETATRTLARFDTANPHLAVGELQRIAQDAVMAHTRYAQYEALQEVAFLAVPSETVSAARGEADSNEED